MKPEALNKNISSKKPFSLLSLASGCELNSRSQNLKSEPSLEKSSKSFTLLPFVTYLHHQIQKSHLIFCLLPAHWLPL